MIGKCVSYKAKYTVWQQYHDITDYLKHCQLCFTQDIGYGFATLSQRKNRSAEERAENDYLKQIRLCASKHYIFREKVKYGI